MQRCIQRETVVVDGDTLAVKSARVYDELDKDTTSELSRVWSTQRRRMGVKPGLGIRPGMSVMTPGEPGYIEPPSPHVQIASLADVKMISPRCVHLCVCQSLDALSLHRTVCSHNARRNLSCGWIRASTQAQYAALLTGYGRSSTSNDLSQDDFKLDSLDPSSLGHTSDVPANILLSPPPSPRNEASQDCDERTATSEGSMAAAMGAVTFTEAVESSQSQLPGSQTQHDLGRASASMEALESSPPPMKMKKPKRRSKSLT